MKYVVSSLNMIKIGVNLLIRYGVNNYFYEYIQLSLIACYTLFGSEFFPDDTELPLVCQVDLDLLPSPIECLLTADPVVLL